MPVTVYHCPNCSTCRKALKFLLVTNNPRLIFAFSVVHRCLERANVSRSNAFSPEAPMLHVQTPDPEWGGFDQGQKTLSVSDLLGDLPLFELLTKNDLLKLERIVHVRMFTTGEIVIRANAPRLGLYVIQAGSAQVVRRNPDGTSRSIGKIGTGELIGEFSLLDSSPRTSGIVALEPSTLIGFFQPDLMAVIDTDPQIGFKILHRLTQMMAEQHRRDMSQLRQLRKELAAAKTVN